MFDLLLRGGRVVDGSGLPGEYADVAIVGDRIAAVSRFPAASSKEVLDVTGLTVTPGFVDAHVHGDLPVFVDPMQEAAIRQGITTFVLGQDGVAFAPAGPATMAYMRQYTAGFNGGSATPDRTWNTIADYLNQLDGASAVNACVLIPNGNVRMEAMGLAERRATAAELAAMRQLVRAGMEQGAVGLSSGLDYIPSLYADEDELTALCEVIAEYGGVYVTHMRGYTPAKFPAALQEVLNIGRRAGCAVHVSHFNVVMAQAEPVLAAARDAAIDLTFDLYCYLYGSTIVGMVTLPPELNAGGTAATIERLKLPETRQLLEAEFASPRFPLETLRFTSIPHTDWKHHEGKRLVECATTIRGRVDFVCDLLIATEMTAGCVIRHFAERTEADIRLLMKRPEMMAGSDGIFVGGCPHPRGNGCFAKYLGEYVRNGTWSLETAVRRLSFHAARRHGLRDRGLLAPGFAADVAVFDPAIVADTSTYDNGRSLALGMVHVLVNGEFVLKHGTRTAACPGRGLRRGTGNVGGQV